MHGNTLRKTALVAALGLCLASLAALQPAHAASNDGALAGQLLGAEGGALEGATITVRNTETGLTRTVRADADGNFRFPFLPIGDYVLIMGRVLAMHVRDDCVLDPARHYIDAAKLGLIGRMAAPDGYVRTTDRFAMPRATAEQVTKRG